MNKSILDPQINQGLEKERTDHMAYLPDMGVLDPQIGKQVLSLVNAYGPSAYMAAGVKTALARETRTLEDFAILLSLSTQPLSENIAKAAQVETRKHFGNSIHVFTPIYIANYYESYCIYRGFNCKNKIRRVQLKPEQTGEEMRSITHAGLKKVLILTGENRAESTVSYIGKACKIVRGYFKMIGLEIYPLNSGEYAYLYSCGVDYVTIFQETYNPDKYETLHLSGHRRRFPHRLNAQERALKGGMRGVGLGAPLGLSDFREDALATGCYARLLQREYPHGKVAFSCPHLRPTINSDKISPMDVHETQLLQIVTAYHLLIPWVSITVSAREYAKVRDHLASIAATKVSAKVNTRIGGHSEEIEEEGDNQFEISGNRSVDQVFRGLLGRDPQPVINDYIYV